MDGRVPPFSGNLGTTFCTSRGGWVCLIHPAITTPPYSSVAERVTRVVVHELGHTLAECGLPNGREHGYPYGCYLLDSDATLEGLPPLCPEEAAMARGWALDHGVKRVAVKDAWLRAHVVRAVAVWNDGAGVEVFRVEE